MALATYANLKTSVANYLGRTDLTDQIVDFIKLGEIRLQRTLRLREMLKSVNATTVSGNNKLALPTDFIEVRDLHIDSATVTPLEFLTPAAFSANARVTDSGLPINYTVLAEDFKLAPIPDSTYTVAMLYFAKPAELSDTNTTNVFLQYAPDALLYSTLVEAEPYLMNDTRLQTWAAMLERSIDGLNDTAIQSQYSGVPLTMKLTKR